MLNCIDQLLLFRVSLAYVYHRNITGKTLCLHAEVYYMNKTISESLFVIIICENSYRVVILSRQIFIILDNIKIYKKLTIPSAILEHYLRFLTIANYLLTNSY